MKYLRPRERTLAVFQNQYKSPKDMEKHVIFDGRRREIFAEYENKADGMFIFVIMAGYGKATNRHLKLLHHSDERLINAKHRK